MTTQQSGFIGPGDAESSQVLVKSLVKAAFRGERCSGLLGRTSLRLIHRAEMRRDSISCSGLLGRTSLRHEETHEDREKHTLFRPSRPDFIETYVL